MYAKAKGNFSSQKNAVRAKIIILKGENPWNNCQKIANVIQIKTILIHEKCIEPHNTKITKQNKKKTKQTK